MSELNDPQPRSLDGDSSELNTIIEAALFTASEPLSIKKLQRLFPDGARPETSELKAALAALSEEFAHRGLELAKVGKGWRFRSREKYAPWLRRLTITNPPRFSKALLETLSIIAYRQPVTRGDIEEIRGVAVSTEIIRALEDRGWVAEIGFRDVPGRPALFGTTDEFLDYFGIESLGELPELMEPRSISVIAQDLNLKLPESEVADNETDELVTETEATASQHEAQNVRPSAEIIPMTPPGGASPDTKDD